MRSNILLVFCLSIAVAMGACSSKKEITKSKSSSIENIVEFEVSNYGLIFTEIMIAGNKIMAMIDFGDFNVLQISSTYVDKYGLSVKETNSIFMDLLGNQFKVNQGTLKEVLIGSKIEKEVLFSSSPGEMESVSKQINTEFHAVVGWGYFKKYYTTLEYSKLKFTLCEEVPMVQQKVAESQVLDNDSYLIIPIEINGQNLNALLDTGSPVSLIDTGLGLDGLMEFKIGDSPIQESFISEDLSMLQDLNVQVMLGGTFLSNYKVHINSKDLKIIFE